MNVPPTPPPRSSRRPSLSVPVHAHELLVAHRGARLTAITPRIPHGDVGATITIRSGITPRQSRMTSTSRARILRIHPVRLGDLTNTDAIACGYRDLTRFRVAWIRRHERDPRWDNGFRLGLLGDTDADMRWEQRWAHVTAWATLIEHDPTHTPRLLARRSEHGYTASPRLALQHEPEAIK